MSIRRREATELWPIKRFVRFLLFPASYKQSSKFADNKTEFALVAIKP